MPPQVQNSTQFQTDPSNHLVLDLPPDLLQRLLLLLCQREPLRDRVSLRQQSPLLLLGQVDGAGGALLKRAIRETVVFNAKTHMGKDSFAAIFSGGFGKAYGKAFAKINAR